MVTLVMYNLLTKNRKNMFYCFWSVGYVSSVWRWLKCCQQAPFLCVISGACCSQALWKCWVYLEKFIKWDKSTTSWLKEAIEKQTYARVYYLLQNKCFSDRLFKKLKALCVFWSYQFWECILSTKTRLFNTT